MKYTHYIYITLLTIVLTAAVLMGCQHGPQYPQALVEADSAYMRGNYPLGDSLLVIYISDTSKSSDEASLRYEQLIELEKLFVYGQLTDDYFSVADSVYRYYTRQDQPEEHAKALLFVGETYRMMEAFPQALDCFLNAETAVENSPASALKGWIWQRQGDLYFHQKMFGECKQCYRLFYDNATLLGDTLRMAHAANRIGKVYTIENNVDSTVYYYRLSMSLAERLPQKASIEPFSRRALADIFIQTEQFDEARQLMTHTPDDDINWAYWYLGKGMADSAIVCFERNLSNTSLYGQAELLKVLARLKREKGDDRAVIRHLTQLSEVYDTISSQLQVEETRRTKTLYEYELVKQKYADEDKKRSRDIFILTIIAVSSFLFSVVLLFAWKSNKAKRTAELEHERLLRKEQNERNKQSQQTIHENEQKIAALEQQLDEARQQGDQEKARLIELNSNMLKAENRNIEAVKKRNDYLENQFRMSPLYAKIIRNAKNSMFTLTEEEWEQLGRGIDETYNNFSVRLFEITSLETTELRVLYLMKLDIQPVYIAYWVGRTKAAISLMSKRLAKRLIGDFAQAKDLHEFIISF